MDGWGKGAKGGERKKMGWRGKLRERDGGKGKGRKGGKGKGEREGIDRNENFLF